MTSSKDHKSHSDAPLETRGEEENKFWFRSDRFFKADGQWYFTTREHHDVGPFITREYAEHGLQLFIDCIQKQNKDVEYAIEVAKNGDWAVSMFQ